MELRIQEKISAPILDIFDKYKDIYIIHNLLLQEILQDKK